MASFSRGSSIRSWRSTGRRPSSGWRRESYGFTERRPAIMSGKAQTLQEVFLTHLRERKMPVTIFLMNGIKLQGIIDWFDNFSMVLRRDRQSQLVYKRTISTIVPMMAVQLLDSESSPQQGKATLSLRSGAG